MKWWLTCMKKYVDFGGRARRTEYWMFYLFNLIFGLGAIVLDNILGIANDDLGYGLIYGLYALVIILPSWAVLVRRLHDVGKSGWWIFINLIPLIGSIWMFVLMVSDSESGDNQYGPNPKINIASI